jgi:hypothetical protein
MKLGMDGMPFEVILKRYFQFPTVGCTNMADGRTCEVEAILVEVNVMCLMTYLKNTKLLYSGYL